MHSRSLEFPTAQYSAREGLSVNVASQSMPSHYPIYEASALNGLPSVRFTGSALFAFLAETRSRRR